MLFKVFYDGVYAGLYFAADSETAIDLCERKLKADSLPVERSHFAAYVHDADAAEIIPYE